MTGTGTGTLPLAVGDTSGALIAASRAANAVNVALATPAAGTEMVGEPTLTLDYSGTATNPDGRLYAQIISNSNGLVLGNQVTPIPVTLDGQAHTLTIPLEAVAADVGTSSSYTLQITDGTSVYFAARTAGAVDLSSISVSVPTVAAGSSQVVTGPTPTGANATAPGKAAAASAPDLPNRFADGAARHPGSILIALSGNDTVAAEFKGHSSRVPALAALLARENVSMVEFPGVDHTFSRAEWRDAGAAATIAWLRAQFAT